MSFRVIFDRGGRLRLPAHVRFTPKATELLRRREMTQRATSARQKNSAGTFIPAAIDAKFFGCYIFGTFAPLAGFVEYSAPNLPSARTLSLSAASAAGPSKSAPRPSVFTLSA